MIVLSHVQPAMGQNRDRFNNFKQKRSVRFQNFKDKKQQELDEFRRKRNIEFAAAMGNTKWKAFDKQTPTPKPVDKDVPPIISDDNRRQDEKRSIKVTPYIISVPEPQPNPITPIKENKDIQKYGTFSFYGTKMKARWGDLASFRLASKDEKGLGKAYELLTDPKYDNLLYDCLELRKSYQLCDWAYYLMLGQLSETVCGKGSNEAVFLQGVLYHQSGYMMRFGFEQGNHNLHLLVRFDTTPFLMAPFVVEGKIFYAPDNVKSSKVHIFDKAFDGEKEMTLSISKSPLLAKDLSEEKTIHARSYPLVVKSIINKNLINFFNDYPASYRDDNFMTKWAYYGNTPVSGEIRNQVYPKLREAIQNVPQLNAVNLLLNWVQPLHPQDNSKRNLSGQVGLPYGNDDAMWGRDRTFFAEETLYYPYSDCEDHAILFSHLVRDLVGLDVALVYYPGHLATAVCFDVDVAGDSFIVDGRKFVIADPTLYRGKVGETMSQYWNTDPKEIKLIVLDR